MIILTIINRLITTNGLRPPLHHQLDILLVEDLVDLVPEINVHLNDKPWPEKHAVFQVDGADVLLRPINSLLAVEYLVKKVSPELGFDAGEGCKRLGPFQLVLRRGC